MVSFDGLVGRLGVTNIFHLDVKIDKETLTIYIPSNQELSINIFIRCVYKENDRREVEYHMSGLPDFNR